MNKELMDFWGNFFINAAKGQKQMEETADWSRRMVDTLVVWTASFQKLYNLEALVPAAGYQSRDWNRNDGSQKSLVGGFMKLWGVKNGPGDEHVELIKRYEELKERLMMQEETIRHLRILLEDARRENLSLTASRYRDSAVDVDPNCCKPTGYPT